MASTILGTSGRAYIQHHPLQPSRENIKPCVFQAESGGHTFVLKRVARPHFDLSMQLAAELSKSRHLRIHLDQDVEQKALIYPYFHGTLLDLFQQDRDVSEAERKNILYHVGLALQELHTRDWIHLDVKPDNILLNWKMDKQGQVKIIDVALGDFDLATKLKDTERLRTLHPIGNAMWRSPEGQTGRGITKASDVFSFALVCIYTLGGADLLLLKNYQELVDNGVEPEQEILMRHFTYFGLASDGLLKQVDDATWNEYLQAISRGAEKVLEVQPERSFTQWGKDLGDDAYNLISGMTCPDPTTRPTIDQVMEHTWWQTTA